MINGETQYIHAWVYWETLQRGEIETFMALLDVANQAIILSSPGEEQVPEFNW